MTRRLHLAALLAGALLAAWGSARAEPRLLIIPSSGEPAYQSVVDGIQRNSPDLRMDTQLLPVSRDTLERLVREAGPDTVLMPLGARASQAVNDLNPAAPVVACFLVNASGIRRGPQWQTSTVELPPEIQANWIRRVLPAARTAGVLFNPGESTAKADALAQALRRAGFQPLLAEAQRPADIDAALEQLRDRADLLVGIPDLTVFNPIAAKTIMLFSYRHRIPVIGLSQSWARAGAVFSVEWDPEDHGRYCGQLAQRALGTLARVDPLRKLRTSVNLRAAAYMHLSLAPDLVGMFSAVFE